MQSKPNRCRAEVMRGFHLFRCRYKAVTEAGFCRTHDPVESARRAAKRPPSKFHKAAEVRRALDAAVALLPEGPREAITRLLAEERSFR